MTQKFSAVLFDLDGTLLDTAPTIAYAIKKTLAPHYKLHNLNKLPYVVSSGLIAMMKHCVPNITEDEITLYRPQILSTYHQHINHLTKPFPNIATTLTHLKDNGLAWAIVTNKMSLYANALLTHYPWAQDASCVVCGDTVERKKPDPLPLLHAVQQLQLIPEECIYVGDHINDIIAGKAANMKTIIADFGYIDPNTNKQTWQADATISCASELANTIKRL